jgi:hypothetical protein
MRIPERLREPLVFVMASVFGVAVVVVALIGSWPWLAVLGPLITIAVLVSAWHGSGPDHAPFDVVRPVRGWAMDVNSDHSARADVDRALTLAGDVDDLFFQNERKIVHTSDASVREATLAHLRERETFLATRLKVPPSGDVDWDELVNVLTTAKEELQAMLKGPAQDDGGS